MWKIVSLIILTSLYIYSSYYYRTNLSSSGFYIAHMVVVNKEVSESVITTHINDGHFISKTYISTPGLSSPSIFTTKGSIIDDINDGTYKMKFVVTQEVNGKVIDINNIGSTIGLAGKVGLEVNESFKVIYHSKNYEIINLESGDGVFLYARGK